MNNQEKILRAQSSIKDIFFSLYDEVRNLDLRPVEEQYYALNKRYYQIEANKSNYSENSSLRSLENVESNFIRLSEIIKKLKGIKEIADNIVDELGLAHLSRLQEEALDLYPKHDNGDIGEKEYNKYLEYLIKQDEIARADIKQHAESKIPSPYQTRYA